MYRQLAWYAALKFYTLCYMYIYIFVEYIVVLVGGILHFTIAQVILNQWANRSKSRLSVICGGKASFPRVLSSEFRSRGKAIGSLANPEYTRHPLSPKALVRSFRHCDKAVDEIEIIFYYQIFILLK